MTINKIKKAIIWLVIAFTAWASLIFALDAGKYQMGSKTASNYVQKLLVREKEWILNGIEYDCQLGAAPFCNDIELWAKQSVVNTGLAITFGGLALCGVMVVSTINDEDNEAD